MGLTGLALVHKVFQDRVVKKTAVAADQLPDGGFFNAATLTAGGEDITDHACAEPVSLTITKTARDVIDNDDGTWTVTYAMDVANPDDDQTVTYDLVDFTEDVGIVKAWSRVRAPSTPYTPTGTASRTPRSFPASSCPCSLRAHRA